MSFLWISALKDVRRLLMDRAALTMWLGIPLLIGGLMSLAMGGGGGVSPKAKLLVADLDDSFVSQGLVSLASGGGEEGVLQLTELELQDAEARMSKGEASGLLVIPAGFGDALFQQAPTELRLVTNPSQHILPGILREGLELLVEALCYVQQLFGSELATFASGPGEGASFFGNAVIASQSIAINNKLREVEQVLFPPVLELETEIIEKPSEPAKGGIGLLLFPGTVFMALLFVAQGMSDDLWTEVDSGTLRRALAAPRGLGAVLAGKCLAGVVMIALVCAVSMALGAAAFGIAAVSLLPAFAWATLAGGVLLPLFFFVQTLGQTKRAAGILANILVFPLMMIGGSFFPFEAMPSGMASVGRLTPNGVAVVRFKQILVGELDWPGLATDGAILLLMGAAFFALTLYRARARFLVS